MLHRFGLAPTPPTLVVCVNSGALSGLATRAGAESRIVPYELEVYDEPADDGRDALRDRATELLSRWVGVRARVLWAVHESRTWLSMCYTCVQLVVLQRL